MYTYDFRLVNYPLRLHSGRDALKNLPGEVKRQHAARAFIVCGRTVSRQTALIERLRTLLGEMCAGVFDEMAKESPLAAIVRARDAARDANADLLIGVGAGSVIQATRVVAILLAEQRPVEELITQYPEHGSAVSPKLMAPKIPIINVLTAATSAQNRAGSAVKSENMDHRMEFFDPKTRPVALFWDADALLTAPATLARDTGAAVLWRAVMNLGAAHVNPLVEGDRLQAYRLARSAMARIGDAQDAGPRIDLCAAAFLQNRDADDGGTMFERHWAGRVIYAFAAALFNLHPHVSQGAANCALSGTVIRKLGGRNLPEMTRIAQALDAWNDNAPPESAPQRAADALDALFRDIGMPTRVGELDVPKESAERMLEHALKNFNADPKREFLRERDLLKAVLLDAW
ncbi:MAG: iron-containing alcohol dehydrogenase family protein [Betaproteobacteria bacterium]